MSRVAGEWFCPKCSAEEDVAEEEEKEEVSAGKKRKAAPAVVEKKGGFLGSECTRGVETDRLSVPQLRPRARRRRLEFKTRCTRREPNL